MKISAFLLLLITSTVPLYAQQSEALAPILHRAEALESQELFSQAAQEYLRYQFFCEKKNLPRNPHIDLKLSELSLKRGSFDSAYESYTRYLHTIETPNDADLYTEIRLLEQIGFQDSAWIRLMTLAMLPQENKEIEALLILETLNLALLHQEWETLHFFFAQERTRQIFSEEDQRALQTFLTSKEELILHDPFFAVILSAFIPGLGQLYAGFPGSALNALLLNGSLVGLSVFSFSRGDYGDLILFILPTFYRFYKGNLGLARESANKRNLIKQEKIAQEITRILLPYRQEIKENLTSLSHFSLPIPAILPESGSPEGK